MNWSFLNGLLAFAVTMIVLSTVVAAVLEFVHQVRRKRERYLRAYLLGFFDTQILPMFYTQIAQLAEKTVPIPHAKTQRQLAKILNWVNQTPAGTSWWKKGVFLLIAALPVLVIADLVFHPFLVALVLIGGLYLFYLYDQRRQEQALDAPVDLGALGLSEQFALAGGDPQKLDQFRKAFVDDIAKISTDMGKGDKYVIRIKPTEFAAALGRSNIGKMLEEAGRDRINDLITDIMRRFDDTGASSLAEFRRTSQSWSIWIAFGTAFALNVNAVTLLGAYFTDDDLTAQVLALYSVEDLEAMAGREEAVIVAAYKQTQEDLENKTNELDEEEQKLGSTTNPEDKAVLEQHIARLKVEITDLRDKVNATISALTDVGVPVGWQFFPFCMSDGPVSGPHCAELTPYKDLLEDPPADKDFLPNRPFYSVIERPLFHIGNHYGALVDWYIERAERLTSWFVGVLLAGVLIGLGGPFWFDFYRRLSAVTQVARSLGIAPPKEKATPEADDTPAPPQDPEADHKPNTAVDAFKDAVSAQDFAVPPSRPRRLLNTDGT